MWGWMNYSRCRHVSRSERQQCDAVDGSAAERNKRTWKKQKSVSVYMYMMFTVNPESITTLVMWFMAEL